jgi:amino acid transporter
VEKPSRDAGLIRSVGPWGLAASIVNMVVGASIFLMPASLAANMGVYAPVAILVAAVAVGSVAICFAEGGSRIASSGGAYGYIEAAFGPLAAYVSGTLLWVSNVLACGGISAAVADAAVNLLAPEYRSIAHTLIIVAVIAGITYVHTGGVDRGMRLVKAATLVKLVPLAVFILLGVFAIRGANFDAPDTASGAGFGRAMILAVFAFTGMESALCVSGEVTRPERTIPRALLLAMGLSTALYVAVQVIAQGILGPALGSSTVPLADAIARVSPPLRLLLLAGAAISGFGYVSSDILATPRLLLAFARDGLLPRFLGRVNARTHAPTAAIVCYSLIALLLALTGTFVQLAVLSAMAVAAFYIPGCLAAWVLVRRGVAETGKPLGLRWLGLAMSVGIATMLAMIALAAREEILGLFALIVASIVVYLAQTRLALRRVSP